MTTSKTHTHRGTCQSCGRLQASDNAMSVLAKHGYTVEGGYFLGTCMGSGYLPLEIDRARLDATVEYLHNWVVKNTKFIAAVRRGDESPGQINSLKKEVKDVIVRRRAPWGDHKTQRSVAIMVDWTQADDAARLAWLRRQERSGVEATSSANSLLQLAKEVHGKPLKAVVDSKPKAGDKFRMHKQLWVITGFVNHMARGLGPALNGQHIDFAQATSNTGKTWEFAVCRLGRALNAARKEGLS